MKKLHKLGVLGFALALGIMMSGCAIFAAVNADMNGVETETSKMLLGAATEVLLSRESGLAYDVFKVAYESKVDGLRVSMVGMSYTELSLTYQGRKYLLSLTRALRNSKEVLTAAQKCVDVTKE